MELVYMDGKKEPYTTSAIIAECAGVKHHAIQEHIRKQIGRLEQFGKVSFKMRPLQSGQQAKDYILNEQQAYIEHAEKEYLEATITLKDILFNSKKGTQKANKSCLIEKFEEAMQ